MAVAKMKLVNIVGRLKDFDRVVQKCCINGDFHPEQSSLALEQYEEFIPIDEPNPYEKATQKAIDIAVHSDIPLHYVNFDRLGLSFEQMSACIDKAGGEIGTLNGKVSSLSQEAAKLSQILTSLSHLQEFNINLDDLFGCQYIVFRFGRLPKDSYLKLEAGDESEEHIFFPLEEDDLYYWGFYVVHKPDLEETDEFFASLYFERINVIEEAHGTPQAAAESIRSQLAQVNTRLEEARAAVRKYWASHAKSYLAVYSHLRYLHDSFDIRRYASKCDDYFYIFGWVTERDIGSFTRRFEHISNVDCIVEPTKEAGNITPPTKIVNNRLVKPFEMLLGMYGIPDYNEIDPTPFMALTYTLIFGIMFGDLGQGALIFAFGLFLWLKKRMPLGAIMYRIGVSSMIFGTLYNSVFGYEDILPFTILPVHRNDSTTTMTLLGVTVGLGILIIIIGMGLNIVNAIRQNDKEKLLFSQNGITGLVFYVSLLVLCGLLFLVKGLPRLIVILMLVLLIILPVVLMFFKEPLTRLAEHRKDWKPEKFGEFFISSFFEVFESLLSFATNTISFVRVGAYVLSHAGMMTAVFVLAGLAGGGYPVVVIIGNLFVLLLEGFVVAIQGIRLQYYEIFSRFYDGNGKEFKPTTIRYE